MKLKNSQLNGLNPWLSMWSRPRITIRSLLSAKPEYGLFRLVTLFALESFFFYANWWSLGLAYSFSQILLAGVVLSPLIGAAWLYVAGWIYCQTGRALGGTASASSLRTAIAWSKLPAIITLSLWIVLLIIDPRGVFIQALKGGHSLVFMTLANTLLGIWSFVLLIQSLREVQGFSLGRALFNVFLSSLIFSILVIFFSFIFNYITN